MYCQRSHLVAVVAAAAVVVAGTAAGRDVGTVDDSDVEEIVDNSVGIVDLVVFVLEICAHAVVAVVVAVVHPLRKKMCR